MTSVGSGEFSDADHCGDTISWLASCMVLYWYTINLQVHVKYMRRLSWVQIMGGLGGA